jgi:hypothetical protein
VGVTLRPFQQHGDLTPSHPSPINEERPHAALGNATPAEHYQLPPRRWDGVLREPEYPAEAALRRVHHNRAIRWRSGEIYLSEALVGEPVGLVARQDGGWTVHYGPMGYPQPPRPNSHSKLYEQNR